MRLPGADGTGETGFTVPDENLPDEGEGNYPAGTVAMANRGPDTASSQVFLVYQKTTLPAGYTIVGKVSEGLDVVKHVAAGAWRRDHRMRPMDHRHNPS